MTLIEGEFTVRVDSAGDTLPVDHTEVISRAERIIFLNRALLDHFLYSEIAVQIFRKHGFHFDRGFDGEKEPFMRRRNFFEENPNP